MNYLTSTCNVSPLSFYLQVGQENPKVP